MRRTHLLLAVAFVSCLVPASAQQPAGAQSIEASAPGKAAIANTIQITAEVVGLDKAKRIVKLKGPKGNVVEFVADEKVKNFDQLKVGDKVTAQVLEALTLQLKKAGADAGPTGAKMSEDTMGAKPGEKPAGMAVKQLTVVAKITALDEKAKTITVMGPDGTERVLNVNNPEHFKVAQVGDQIEAVVTYAIAVAVEPAAKKPAPKKAGKPAPKKAETKQ